MSQGQIGQDHPIAYASRILNKAEQNYNTTEKKTVDYSMGDETFSAIRLRNQIPNSNRSQAVNMLFSVNDPGLRLIRWRLKLEEYDYEIIHCAGKGKGNTNADVLSRNPITNDSKTLHIIKKEKEREYSEEDKRQILSEYHDAALGRHQGVTRTLNRIRLTHN